MASLKKMRCSDRGGVYYPRHDGPNHNGHCDRCGEIVDAARHGAAVAQLRADLERERERERKVGRRTDRGDELRADLAAELSRDVAD